MDRAMLRALSGRAQSVITLHCVPVACDVASRVVLYDAIELECLAAVPTRNRARTYPA